MAKVLAFPVKKKLPKEVEERLHEITETYIGSMYEVLDSLCDDPTDLEELNEMSDLMLEAVIEGLFGAISKLGES